MSRNLTDHQRSPRTQLARTLREANRHVHQQRTVQLQGNEALQLFVDYGYFEIEIPTTPTTKSSSIPLPSLNQETVMMVNLMYSVYYPVFVDYTVSPDSGYIFYQQDAHDIYRKHLSYECFLSFDDRENQSGVLASQAAVLGTAIPDHSVRLTTRLRSRDSWSLPAGSSNRLWIYYQIRATVAGGIVL